MGVNNTGLQAALGIDVGGTKVLVGLVTRDGHILAIDKRSVIKGDPQALLDAIIESADRLLREKDENVEVCAVGMGFKGHVRDNRVISSSILGGAISCDFAGMLTERFHLPVFIDNDVNAAAVAEAHLGAGRSSDFFVYVNIGTGSAVGIYDQGRLVRGCDNYSGEIGYTLCRLPQEDRIFCLEDVASGKGLSDETHRLAHRHPESVLYGSAIAGQRIPAAEIFAAWHSGDALASEVITRAVEVLAMSVINFECMLGSGLYIFGGGVVSEPTFFERIRERVCSLVAELGLGMRFEMRVSTLGAANVGLLGAAGIAFDGMP